MFKFFFSWKLFYVFVEVKTGVLSVVSTINDEDLNVKSPPMLASRKEESIVDIPHSNGENDADTVSYNPRHQSPPLLTGNIVFRYVSDQEKQKYQLPPTNPSTGLTTQQPPENCWFFFFLETYWPPTPSLENLAPLSAIKKQKWGI